MSLPLSTNTKAANNTLINGALEPITNPLNIKPLNTGETNSHRQPLLPRAFGKYKYLTN
jgi:hypothetical protein